MPEIATRNPAVQEKKGSKSRAITVPVRFVSPAPGRSGLGPVIDIPVPSSLTVADIVREFEGRILGLERQVRQGQGTEDLKRRVEELEGRVITLTAQNNDFETRLQDSRRLEMEMRENHMRLIKIIEKHGNRLDENAKDVELMNARYWFLNDRINEAHGEDMEYVPNQVALEPAGSDEDGEGSDVGDMSGPEGEVDSASNDPQEYPQAIEEDPMPALQVGHQLSGIGDETIATTTLNPDRATPSAAVPGGKSETTSGEPQPALSSVEDNPNSAGSMLSTPGTAIDQANPLPGHVTEPTHPPIFESSAPPSLPGGEHSCMNRPPVVEIIPPTPSSSLDQVRGALLLPIPTTADISADVVERRRSPRHRSPTPVGGSRAATPSGPDGVKKSKRKGSEQPGPAGKK